jgi:hypothetical protein
MSIRRDLKEELLKEAIIDFDSLDLNILWPHLYILNFADSSLINRKNYYKLIILNFKLIRK